jgi:hypothetical protein
MANRRGKYMLTTRRRAALKKAQLASARKRRRRVGGGIALGAGILAVSAGGYYAHRQLKGGPKRHPSASVGTPVTTPYRPPFGSPKKLKLDPRYSKGPIHKQKARAARRKAKRVEYEQKRRMAYWSGRKDKAAWHRPNNVNGVPNPHKPKPVYGSPKWQAQQKKKVTTQKDVNVIPIFKNVGKRKKKSG